MDTTQDTPWRQLLRSDLARTQELIGQASPDDLREWVELISQHILGRLWQDARAALRESEQLEQVAKATGDPVCLARALWIRGHALGETLHYNEALASYERATGIYRQNGQAHQAAKVTVGQINVLTHLGETKRALQLGEQSRAILVEAGDAVAAIRLDCNLATLYHRLEHRAEALAVYDRALSMSRNIGDTAMERVVQHNRAGLLARLGDLEEARAIYQLIRPQSIEAGEVRVAASIDTHLAYIAVQRGEYAQAFDHLEDARTRFEDLEDSYFLLQTLLELAALLLEVNAFERARAMATRAVDQARAAGLPREEAHGVFLQGVAMLGLKDVDRGAELLRRALALHGSQFRGSRALCSLYLAECEVEQGKRRRAARRLRWAAGAFARDRSRLLETTAWLRLGWVELADDRIEAAQAALVRARRRLRSVASRWLRAQSAQLAGDIARARGNNGAALRHYRRSLALVETLRARVGLDEFRVSFSHDKAPLYARTVEILLDQERPDTAEAFALVERSRARALLDALTTRLRPDELTVSPRAKELVDRIQEVRAHMNGHGRHAGSPASEDAVRPLSPATLRGHEEELADLYQRLGRHDSRLGSMATGETVGLADVQASLNPEQTLVEYFTDTTRVCAFVVTRTQARVVQLSIGADALARHVEFLRFQIEKRLFGESFVSGRADALQAALDQRLRALSDDIWLPLEIESREVIVVPHGTLHAVPFYALMVNETERVLDRHLLVQLPSASLRPSLAAGRLVADDVLVVGVASADLENVEREVQSIAQRFPARVLRGDQATAAKFADQSRSADVIHVATHGVYRPEDPMFSGILLADGWFDLHSICRLRLRQPLVVLSACQTGRLATTQGDELVGLARGFFYAGARALLASLWSVDDQVTARLMDRFYANLVDSVPPAEALRAAMIAVRDTRPDPFHWAPFLYLGDPS